MPVALLPSFIQGLIIKNGQIKSVIFRRYVIGEHPVDELCQISLQKEFAFPIIFHFDDGYKIRFVGANIGECQRLIDDLAEMVDRKVVVDEGNVQRFTPMSLSIPSNWEKLDA